MLTRKPSHAIDWTQILPHVRRACLTQVGHKFSILLPQSSEMEGLLVQAGLLPYLLLGNLLVAIFIFQQMCLQEEETLTRHHINSAHLALHWWESLSAGTGMLATLFPSYSADAEEGAHDIHLSLSSQSSQVMWEWRKERKHTWVTAAGVINDKT